MVDSQLKSWLTSLGLAQYYDAFVSNDVDFRAVPFLTEDDLRELGLSLGHRRILLAAQASLEETAPIIVQPDDGAASAGSEPERRHLTVMFCDLVGSTQLSNELDPEELRELLQLYQNTVTEAVRHFDGYIAKFLGDGVVAYFGWPQAYEDQAERAVRASLYLMAAIHKRGKPLDHRFEARIGIATGHVVVGDLVGETLSDTEAVVGETPNRASRLQDVGNAGDIVIGQRTRKLVGQMFELEALGPQNLKGFADPVHAFRVIRESDVETRFEAAQSGELTQRVGREHELGLIAERWQLASDGDGQVLLLSGEAGIGKSRLIQDFRDQIDTEDYEHLYLQCLPSRTNSAFFPVVRYFRQAAGIRDEELGQTKLDKLERLLAEGEDRSAVATPVFASLLSLPGTERYGEQQRSPQQLRSQAIEKFVSYVVAKSEARPVLCLVEDAHWMDPSMGELVGELILQVVDRPICLIITFRPEFTPPWPDYAHVSSMNLNRLHREQAARIVESVGGEALMVALVDQIVNRSDGVPLYIEELTKSVLERVSVRSEEAIDHLIPATLHSSLVARIDRLGSAKETAQIGAVIGREFSFEMLADTLDKPQPAIKTDLDRLIESGLIIRRGGGPDALYSFKHSLVHDATYSTILRSRRRSIHARIIKTLERQLANNVLERVDTLAHHAFLGEQWEKAFDYLAHSGTRAMRRSALQEAAAQFEHALQSAVHLKTTPEIQSRVIEVKFELRNALWALGRFEDILTHLDEAEHIASALENPATSGWISVFKSASHWQLGQADSALAAAEQALKISVDSKDPGLEVAAKFYLGCAHITSGNYQTAETHFHSIASALQGEREREQCGLPFAPAVIARSWLAWSLAERGEFEQADITGDEALAIAKNLGHPFNLAHIYYDLGYFYELQGRLDHAIDALETANRYVRDWQLTYLSPFIMGFLGHVYALTGRSQESVELLRDAQAAYERIGLGLFRSMVAIQFGEALLLAGDVEQARSTTTTAVALARKRGERGHMAYGLRVLGDIAFHQAQNETPTALDHYQEALAIASSCAMRPLEAQCHIRLSQFFQLMSQTGRADTHAGEAAAIAEALNMTFWPHIENAPSR